MGTVASDTGTREGFLVIADISGYTEFLVGTELEHAQGIIADLCAVIHASLVPALRLVKLEGDALFCYAEASRFPAGERLLELIESCHYEFSTRLEQMRRRTTCTCAACASIGTLGLKFVAHYGDFLVQQMLDAVDAAGPNVILVHRLLKNSVTEDTGWRQYLLVTDVCAGTLGIGADWVRHTEDVDVLGTVSCAVHDLEGPTAARREAQRVIVEPGEAQVLATRRIPAAASVIWQYWIDEDKRPRWQGQDVRAFTYDKNEQGRMARGAVGHCDHGSWASAMRYVDWRPFSYLTVERVSTRGTLSAAPAMTETLHLEPLEDGATLASYRMRARSGSGRLVLRLYAPLVRRMLARQFSLLERALREDGHTTAP